MRLPGDNEERRHGLLNKYVAIGISMGALLILGTVFLTNKDSEEINKEKENPVMALDYENEEDGNLEADAEEPTDALASGSDGTMKDIEKLYKENKLTASDLDFWDMYPKNEPEFIKEEDLKEESDKEKDGGEETSEEENGTEETDPSEDGKHTLLTYADGTEEWVLMNPYLEKNTYDFTRLTMKSDKMAYYEDGKKSSYIGIDISKYNGDVSFSDLKESGIDFVMLRAGARGYGSGQIMLDEKFTDNITKATEAGLDIGVYFFSQAISADEAVEEANFVIQNLTERKITYPVVFDMEYVANDTARIEALSRDEKTAIAKKFLETIKGAGYKTMIYGTKEWLIKEIDMTKLTGYDVWLSQQKDVPDYPYKFQMWQYSLKGSVNGISGDVDLNISFVDYSEK